MIAYGWAAGITLWILAALSASLILARIIEARDTQTPIDDTTGDTMPRMTEYHDDPHYVVGTRSEYCKALTDSAGDVLPIVDAFCQGYAEAILFADAYRYMPCDIHDTAAPIPCIACVQSDEQELVLDENAQYAYQSPGKWWEGMGIDFTDAIDFLAANINDLERIYVAEARKRESAYVGPGLILRNVYAQHGHDFAFTRNHHGAGFWDRGYGEAGDRLTDAAEAYGEHSVLTDDGPTVTTL